MNDKDIEPLIIEYLKDPPSKEELAEIIQKLNIKPSELIRFNEVKAEELGISASDDLTLEECLTILIENPVLIESQIVISAKGAVIWRPPENVLELLT
jgi:arsenate reductase